MGITHQVDSENRMQRLAKIAQRLLPWLVADLIVMTVSPPAAAQQSANPRILAVTGHGHDQAPTTLAQITLGISDQGNSAKAAYDQLNKRSSAVTKLLKSRKVDQVKTSNINLSLKSDRDGKPKKDDYEGYRNIEFQVPANNIGVLDDAIATNIDQVPSIRNLATDQSILTARTKALEAAIADAQAQTKVALDQLGFSIEEVVDIQIDDAIVQTPGTDAASQGDTYSGSGRWSGIPAVNSGEQAVDIGVTLKVRY